MAFDEWEEQNTYLGQGIPDASVTFRNVQGQNFSCIDDQRDNAGCDQNGDEKRGDWVEAGPSVELDQQRRNNNSKRTESILHIKCISTSVSQRWKS